MGDELNAGCQRAKILYPWRFALHHSMFECVKPFEPLRGRVSIIFNALLDNSLQGLSIEKLWDKELSKFRQDLDWDTIWLNLSQTYKNLAHQLIHYKTIHGAYATPYRKFRMNRAPSYTCNICNASPGTCIHMFWECPKIADLWTFVVDKLNLNCLTSVSQEHRTFVC